MTIALKPWQWEVLAEILCDHINAEVHKRKKQLEYAETSKRPPRENAGNYSNRINSLKEIHEACTVNSLNTGEN